MPIFIDVRDNLKIRLNNEKDTVFNVDWGSFYIGELWIQKGGEA